MRALTVAFLFAITFNVYGQVPDYVPSDGLMAWHLFTGNADDESGNGNNGTVIGSTSTTDRNGNVNSAYSFDGVDDHISLNINLGNFGVSDFTISAWQLKTDINLVGTVFGKRNSTGDGNMINFTSGPNYELSTGSGDYVANTYPYQVEDIWFHSVLIREGLNIRVYLNGLLVGNETLTTIHDINNLAISEIGARWSGATIWNLWNGKIDDVGIWNRALSEEEIANLFSAPAPQYGCIDSVACNFNENAIEDDGSCDYTCCPGPGCCGEGMNWNSEIGECEITNPTDTNLDGCTDLNDLMDILANYGDCICQDDYMLTFSGGSTETCCCTGGNSGNSYILADVSPNLSNASTATVEFWLHLDTYTQYGTILWSEGTGDSSLGVTNAGDCGYCSNQYKTGVGWGGADILSLSTASLGAWQHYALVFDNGTVSYFVDGVSQGTTSSSSSTTPNIPNDWLYFGGKVPGSNGNNQHQVNGSYRSIRVSSTARYSSNFTPEDTLLADSETMHLYSLDEGTGYTVYDSVDSTMTGTIVNGINANETWSLYDTCP